MKWNYESALETAEAKALSLGVKYDNVEYDGDGQFVFYLNGKEVEAVNV